MGKARVHGDSSVGPMMRMTPDVRTEMFAHALRELPNEACGMFSTGPAERLVDYFHPMRNAAESATVFVLDAQRQLRYHGRIDDQYGVGVSRPQPLRSDLSIAIMDGEGVCAGLIAHSDVLVRSAEGSVNTLRHLLSHLTPPLQQRPRFSEYGRSVGWHSFGSQAPAH